MDLSTTHQEVHLSHYWNVIRKRWKVAFSILTVVMIGTFLASYFSKPLYQSKIRLQIERETQAVTIEDIFGIAASDQEFLQTQYVLLNSRGLALRVVEDHKLYNDPELYPPGVAGKTPQELARIKEGIAASLLGGIEVLPVRNTSLVDITYVGTSPRLAQKVAQAWGESYIQMNIAKKLRAVQHASDFLTNQIATVEADLESSRQELQKYTQSRGIIVPGGAEDETPNPVMQTLSQLNSDLTAAQNLVYEKQAAYNALRNTPQEAVAAAEPSVQRLTEELTRLQREYSDKLAVMKEGHPEMQRLSQTIEQTRSARSRSMTLSYNKALEAARAELTAANARLNSVRAAYNQQRGAAQQLNVDSARALDLRLAVEAKQGILAAL
ncbi:MAG TPA: Wzz/FepE/Etk N-terminal domain-containing protein, partial [Thermoanaerobaculia bacterium]|nr:Wzz/FepE/Etk N-terminal domain-containing protein [Thermoanaerobaculia bacterium]